MRDLFGPGTILGYCTNVHAGTDWPQTRKNLEKHAAAVRQRVDPHEPLGVGLWLAQPAAARALEGDVVSEIQAACQQLRLLPFSFNGFPFGDFHRESVKYDVYQPPWDDESRAGYTIALALLHSRLAAPGDERSISTLPLGWRDSQTQLSLARTIFNLHMVANVLANLRSNTGVLMHLDLEPEPGCILQRSEDVVQFFQLLLSNADEDVIRTHVRVCHDICHAAVMFEDQEEMFERYRAAGIKIGKVQISNSIRADLRNLSARERTETLAELRRFSEDRYLHQTTVKTNDELVFYDDLPRALSAFEKSDRAGDEWRVHFHVPVYLESFGKLKTTRDCIIECFKLLKNSEVKHWEVETYAWNVLPEELRAKDLADGIAKELQWVRDTAQQINSSQ